MSSTTQARPRAGTPDPTPEEVEYLGQRGNWHIFRVQSSRPGRGPWQTTINGVTGEYRCTCERGVHMGERRPENRAPCRHIRACWAKLDEMKRGWGGSR